MHNSPAVPIYPHFVNCVGLTPMAALLPREVFSLRLPGMGLSRDPDLGFHDKTLLQTGFKDTGPPTSKRTRNSSNAVVFSNVSFTGNGILLISGVRRRRLKGVDAIPKTESRGAATYSLPRKFVVLSSSTPNLTIKVL